MRRLLVVVMLVLAAGAAGCESSGDPNPQQRQHEILRERPSGFWTSNRPAKGGAYRWRLLGIGCGLLVITGFLTLRAIRRANASRRRP